MTMEQLIVSKNLEKVAAEGNAVIVAYDFSVNRKAKFPDEIVKRIQEMESNQAHLPIAKST